MLWRVRQRLLSKEQRLPRSDIPPDYKCPYPQCSWIRPDNKRPELTFRNHMAQQHGVYYEKAPQTAVSKKMAKYERHAVNLEQLEELAPWHCVALARHVVYGQPLTHVVKEMPGRHSAASLRAVAKSPAGQAFIAKASASLQDPVKLVKDLMASDVFSKHMDWLQAWEWAVESKDYEAIHKMAKDIGLQPVLEQKQQQGPTKISLHLNMSDLAQPAATTRFQVMEAEIVEESEEQDG